MMLEINVYYQNGIGTMPHKDVELCVPAHDISNDDAQRYMSLLESIGAKRHETETQIFYDLIEDARHSREYIFWK